MNRYFSFRLFLAITASVILLSGCKATKVVEQVPVPVHDTTYIAQKVHDSVFIEHWFTREVKGDTVYVTEKDFVNKYIYQTDTAIRYIERPVTVTRTETIEVKKPLPWYQKGLMWAGAIGIFIALAAVAIRLQKVGT